MSTMNTTSITTTKKTSHTTPRRAIALSAAILLGSLTLGSMQGCLISSSKESRISGAYVQPGAVTKVKVNKTTSEEVEEILGQPSSSTFNDDGTETWTWRWSKRTEDDGAVFLIFAGESEKTVYQAVNIQFADGIAIKKWRE